MKKVAVLITCFNRKTQTLACLERLFQINKEIDVFLVDDGSIDGTTETVSYKFPDVILISGNGNLFWNRGMHLAWQEASKKTYDYYLWLNDDVTLDFNAFEELFQCAAITDNKSIITGIIRSQNNEIIYGGTQNKKLIIPNGFLNPVENLNGNTVLVPKFVFDKIGILDPYFHHDLGDVEYGLRALTNNIKVFTTRLSIGVGIKNDLCRVRKNNSNLFERIKYLYSPLGSNPLINFYFKNKKFGFIPAIFYFFFLHFINIIPDLINNKLFGNKYQ